MYTRSVHCYRGVSSILHTLLSFTQILVHAYLLPFSKIRLFLVKFFFTIIVFLLKFFHIFINEPHISSAPNIEIFRIENF